MPHIIYLEETQSTNNYLKDYILNHNQKEETIVVTDFQTAGKGQRGNSWESERGKNLLFSMVIYPDMIKANEQFIISQFVSLAIKDFLNKYTDNISIKWPNDIYWKEQKICGILIENSLIGNTISQSIIGIGININQELFVSDAPNPISLKQITGIDYPLDELLKVLTSFISVYYFNIKNNNAAPIIKHYKESLFRNNGYYLYNDNNNYFLAKIKDVESNGVLVLETKEGIEKRFAFKEVKYKL